MLVFNLEVSKWSDIFELKFGLMHLEAVQVEIECESGGKKPLLVDAGAFVWTGSVDGLIPMQYTSWFPTVFVVSSFYQNIEQSVIPIRRGHF